MNFIYSNNFFLRLWNFIKRNFFTGLVFILPVIVTYSILKFLFHLIYDNMPKKILIKLLPEPLGIVPGIQHLDVLVSFLLTFISIIIIGYFFSNYFGKKIFEFIDGLIGKLPIIHKIYNILKQIIEQIVSSMQGKGGGNSFGKAVIIEFPHKGVYAMGFISSENAIATKKFDKKMINVFVPTTPNPTSGFLIIVSEAEVIDTDMKTEEAMKYIISLGIVNDSKQKK